MKKKVKIKGVCPICNNKMVWSYMDGQKEGFPKCTNNNCLLSCGYFSCNYFDFLKYRWINHRTIKIEGVIDTQNKL